MDWVTSIKQAIDYMEQHLLDMKSADEITREVFVSSFYMQKGFKIMTGYTMTEYIRNRRLYLAGLDIIADRGKIIDLAYKYGYETPESFTKAFSRFHGMSPIQLKKNPSKIYVFQPLKITITIQGGNSMNFTVEKEKAFKLIGFMREFRFENSYQEIPKYWGELLEKQILPLYSREPENETEETIVNCKVGEYGICFENGKMDGSFNYMIAGRYTEGEIPEGMMVYEFPELDWAKFPCSMSSLQSVNTKIFKEWLPENAEYSVAVEANIEWYSSSPEEMEAEDGCGIWVPVTKKQN